MNNIDNAQKAGKTEELNPPQPSSIEDAQNIKKEGYDLLKNGHYEESIAKMEEALKIAIQVVGNEMDYSLVDFYYSYGDAMLVKIQNSEDLFGDPVHSVLEKKANTILDNAKNATSREDAKEEEKEELKDVEQSENEEEEEEKKGDEESKEPPKGECKEEQDDDLEIVWETMETARVIAEKKRETLLDGKNEKEFKEVTRFASRIHMSIGDILSMQERLDDALIEYNKALEMRLTSEEKNSRNLAETYFTIGTTILHTKGKEKKQLKA